MKVGTPSSIAVELCERREIANKVMSICIEYQIVKSNRPGSFFGWIEGELKGVGMEIGVGIRLGSALFSCLLNHVLSNTGIAIHISG